MVKLEGDVVCATKVQIGSLDGGPLAGHGEVESDDGRPSRQQRSRQTELSRVVSDSQTILQSPIRLITKCQLEEDRGWLEVKSRRCSENNHNFTLDC